MGGFEAERVRTRAGALAYRAEGEGHPLLLLHGFPQTRVMWGPVWSRLLPGRKLLAFDLPGYGDSDPPASMGEASKRAMAAALVEAMEALGHGSFDVAGHDRGGRVAYRMALDHPGRVTRLAVLDILPTSDYWARMDRAFALKIYHWAFLAQPHPLPETLIGATPDYWLEWTLRSWTAAGTLDCFDEEALDHYRRNFHDPARLKAMCDDYRAGAGPDVEHDLASRAAGERIAAPTLALWGETGIAQGERGPRDVWGEWCAAVEGRAIRAGHFLPEENPGDTAAALDAFFA